MIDETTRIVYRDFGGWASRMMVLENEDGEPTYILNSRYTREQLLEHLPHEDVHVEENHFQDDRPVRELEAEAEQQRKNILYGGSNHAVTEKAAPDQHRARPGEAESPAGFSDRGGTCRPDERARKVDGGSAQGPREEPLNIPVQPGRDYFSSWGAIMAACRQRMKKETKRGA